MSVGVLLLFGCVLILQTRANDEDFCKVMCDDIEHTSCKNEHNWCDISCEHENNGYKFLTDKQRLEILDTHNKLREKVASGKEVQGDLANVKVSNMEIISWSHEAEYIAACLTVTCVFSHDICRNLLNNTYCGQNLFLKDYSGREGELSKMIRDWYSEVKDSQDSYYDKFPEKPDPPVGHFSQIIWAETYSVGCAYFVYNRKNHNKLYFACNYCPGGNIVSAPVFKRGEAEGRCGKDKRYPHLCGVQAPLQANIAFSHLKYFVTMCVLYLFKLFHRCMIVII